MTGTVERVRPITIAVLAMGGAGGGVLTNWILSLGQRQGYIVQGTSVAGVAQRTGATVYYAELYPPGAKPASTARSEPVLSTFPTPGDVDVVIASELMEAGRSVQRGFCTPDRTVLIASTHRVYSIEERIVPGDGRADSDQLLSLVHQAARTFIGADFEEIAVDSNSVISAALFGALAASQALPFDRSDFEEMIVESGKGVENSLDAFSRGFDAALQPPPAPASSAPASDEVQPVAVSIGPRPERNPEIEREEERDRVARTDPEQLVGIELRERATRVGTEFPAAARSTLLRGCERTAVYQDLDYTDRYLDRVAKVAAVDPDVDGDARLTTAAARHVALWMCYQDTIHVAHQKIRLGRLEHVRREARATDDQLIQVREYLHPQAEELTDTLPTWLGRPLEKSKAFKSFVDRVSRNGMIVNTTSSVGFTMLWITAKLRPLRPKSVRFGREQRAIDDWLRLVVDRAVAEPDLAFEILELQGVIKGYGDTHAKGRENFATLIEATNTLTGTSDAARRLAELRAAALADDDGQTLNAALSSLTSKAAS